MHARLTVNERHKIEKEIATLVSSLSEAVNCGDQRIKELEKQIEQLNRQLADAAKAADSSAKQTTALEKQITELKEELAARNADISVLKLEIKSLTKEGESLLGQVTAGTAEQQALRDRLDAALREKDQAQQAGAESDKEIDSLRGTIQEFEATDAALRERIVELEQLLIVERRKTGQELMSRILELEAMLSVERQRVEEMPELSEITRIDSKVKAANNASVNKSKKDLAKKMG